MSESSTNIVRKLFGMRKEYSASFYFTDFIFRKLLRHNSGVKYPVHFTSTIHNAGKLTVGKETFPGDSPNVYINAQNGITVGDYTNLGPNVGLISANHDTVNNSVATDAPPITIGKFCWMGMNAVVLPGVTLGNFTIVGAGAVVTKSFPEGYCVIGGNPAKVIRELNKTDCDAFAATKG